jgi:hypothetical protein
MDTPKMAGLLGTYDNMRGKLNLVTLITAFVLSIMVIHSHNECENGKGYPSSAPFVSFSYGISITVLVICCILFALDIFSMVMKKRGM